MNPVREALASLLEGDSELTALATGGIHWRSAPQGTSPPVVIFDKYSGTRAWTFGGPPMREEVYLVKGAGTADQAEDIDQRCQDLLTDAALVIDGRVLLMKPLPSEDISMGKDEYGEHFEHAGTYYRITTERASS